VREKNVARRGMPHNFTVIYVLIRFTSPFPGSLKVRTPMLTTLENYDLSVVASNKYSVFNASSSVVEIRLSQVLFNEFLTDIFRQQRLYFV